LSQEGFSKEPERTILPIENPSEELPSVEPIPEDDTPDVDDPEAPPVTQFTLKASDALVSNGMVFENDAVFHTAGSFNPANSGLALFNFNIEVAGEYALDALVLAPDRSSNSFFIDIDREPNADKAWRMVADPAIVKKRVRVGNFAPDPNDPAPEHRFILSEGSHQIFIRGREPNTRLFEITVLKVD